MAGGEGSTWGLGEAAAVAAAGEREAARARALSPSARPRRRRTGDGRVARRNKKIAWARPPLVCDVERASMGRKSAKPGLIEARAIGPGGVPSP